MAKNINAEKIEFTNLSVGTSVDHLLGILLGEPTRILTSSLPFSATSHTHPWSEITATPTTLSGYGITDAQPLDADLTAIASLVGTTGFLIKTAANTWSLDTNTYLTTETDPVFTASPAGGITAGDITNWDIAFGWGNHAVAGYALDSEVVHLAGTETITGVKTFDDTASFVKPIFLQPNLTIFKGTTAGAIGFTSGNLFYFANPTATNTNEAYFSFLGITADRTYTAPDASGTLALTSDINKTNIDALNINADTLDGLHSSSFSLTSHNHTLDSLSNVTITANSSGELLKWNGSAWINNTLAEAGISAVGHTHTFTSLTSIPTTIAGYGITDFNSLGDARWLGISATAANSTLLDSIDSTQFLRSDVADAKTTGDLTFNTNVRLHFGTTSIEGSEYLYNATANYLKLITGDLIIQDNANSRFTFSRTTGNLVATGSGTFTEVLTARVGADASDLELSAAGHIKMVLDNNANSANSFTIHSESSANPAVFTVDESGNLIATGTGKFGEGVNYALELESSTGARGIKILSSDGTTRGGWDWNTTKYFFRDSGDVERFTFDYTGNFTATGTASFGSSTADGILTTLFGVGNGDPYIKLYQILDNTVIESQRWSGTATNYLGYRVVGSNTGYYIQTSNNTTIGAQTFTSRLFINQLTGNVSIGNTNNTYKLDVTGTGRFTGDHTANDHINTSDIRLKSDIHDLKTNVSVHDVNLKSYVKNGRVEWGVIAQELREVLPHAVIGDESKDMLAVSYNQLLMLAIKDIQSQNERLKRLEEIVLNLV